MNSTNYTFKYAPWLIAGLALITLLVNNWSLALWDQDEAAYAGFALNMLETGNWVTPEFAWSDIHRKPPWHFWTMAVSFKLFGVNEWAVRFPSALAVVGTCVLIWRYTKFVFPLKGQFSALVAISALLLTSLGKIATTDAWLIFFETLAALSIFNYIKTSGWKHAVFLWLAIAGGLLTKGPPIWILALGILGFLFLFRTYRVKTLLLAVVCLLGSVPLFLWGRMAWQADEGELVTWMLNFYILQRGEGVLGQTGPPGYFLLLFLLGFFAFVAYLIPGMKDLLQSFFKNAKRKDEHIFLVAWLIFGWLFYEAIPSKLPTYAMGAFPALAIIIASAVSRRQVDGWSKGGMILHIVLSVGMAGALAYLASAALWGVGVFAGYGAAAAVLAFSFFAWRTKNSFQRFYLLCGQLLVVGFLAWTFIVPSVEEKRGATKLVGEYIEASYPKGTRILFAKNFQLPSLAFYVAAKGYEYSEATEEEWNPAVVDGAAVVFEAETYEQFKEYMDVNALKVKQIDGWQYDRGREISYFVVSQGELN